MKPIAQAFYGNPVIFLGAVQVVLTGIAAAGVITGWIPTVSLALVLYLQRRFVTPAKGERS